MIWKYFYTSFFVVNLFWQGVSADDEEEKMCNCIFFKINDNAWKCDGWDDAPIIIDLQMKLEEGDEDAPDMVMLMGNVDSDVEVSSGSKIGIEVNLQTPNGAEMVWSGGSDLCQSMGDTDAPWFPLVSIFNTTECPILKGVYPVPGMMLNLDFTKGCLTSDFIGTYAITITMESGMDKMMCFNVGADLYEEEMACKYCPDQDKD